MKSLVCISAGMLAAATSSFAFESELTTARLITRQAALENRLAVESLERGLLGYSPGRAAPGEPFRAAVAFREDVPAATGPTAEIDLAKLLNKQWTTSAAYPMGGQTAYIGGAFDRLQNAFVSVFTGGWPEPKLFNLKGLLDQEGQVRVGNAAYTVSLSANVLKPMKSEVVFENQADESDQKRVTVRRLLDALTAEGQLLQLSDQAYRVFYYNDVKDTPAGPVVDRTTKTLAMILTLGEDLHVFLIPAELVPADQIAVFTMYADKRVGLQTSGNTLKVYENP